MIAFLFNDVDERRLGALTFQKCKDFKIYLPAGEPMGVDFDGQLPISYGGLNEVEEPLVCFLEQGALPDPNFVRRVIRAAERHPDYDVYHVNLRGEAAFPRRVKLAKFFKMVFLQGRRAPLSSFVFRTAKLREKAVFRADDSLDALATIMACAQERPIRNVWLEKLECPAQPLPDDTALADARVWERIELYRWTEHFFDEEDYPIGVGDRLDLFAAQVAKLYPGRTEEDLKEVMSHFQVAQGPLRKLRASSALKNALKERQKQLV